MDVLIPSSRKEIVRKFTLGAGSVVELNVETLFGILSPGVIRYGTKCLLHFNKFGNSQTTKQHTTIY